MRAVLNETFCSGGRGASIFLIWAMNIKEINLHKARKHRGQIEEKELLLYSSFSDFELSALLASKLAHERTIASTLLGQRKPTLYIKNLCEALQIEPFLYSRLAICEALVNIGSASVPYLSKMIGVVGNNHEKELPLKYFRKNSYPLARDIAVRTLINIGVPSVDYIITLSKTADEFLLSQLIHALGELFSKTKDVRILNELSSILNRVRPNELLEWKIIRAFSAAQNTPLDFLIKYLDHPEPAIRWEAIRTLGLARTSDPKFLLQLQALLLDSNEEVRFHRLML